MSLLPKLAVKDNMVLLSIQLPESIAKYGVVVCFRSTPSTLRYECLCLNAASAPRKCLSMDAIEPCTSVARESHQQEAEAEKSYLKREGGRSDDEGEVVVWD